MNELANLNVQRPSKSEGLNLADDIKIMASIISELRRENKKLKEDNARLNMTIINSCNHFDHDD